MQDNADFMPFVKKVRNRLLFQGFPKNIISHVRLLEKLILFFAKNTRIVNFYIEVKGWMKWLC